MSKPSIEYTIREIDENDIESGPMMADYADTIEESGQIQPVREKACFN